MFRRTKGFQTVCGGTLYRQQHKRVPSSAVRKVFETLSRECTWATGWRQNPAAMLSMSFGPPPGPQTLARYYGACIGCRPKALQAPGLRIFGTPYVEKGRVPSLDTRHKERFSHSEHDVVWNLCPFKVVPARRSRSLGVVISLPTCAVAACVFVKLGSLGKRCGLPRAYKHSYTPGQGSVHLGKAVASVSSRTRAWKRYSA